MRNRPALAGGVALFAVAALVATFLLRAPARSGPAVVEIQTGEGLRTVARALAEANVVFAPRAFRLLVILRGGAKRVHAGEYEFLPGERPWRVATRLIRGEIREHPVTIPEGWNLHQIAERLGQEKLADARAFVAEATDPKRVAALGGEGDTLEGYLFPDTYVLSKGMRVDEILSLMIAHGRAVFTPEMESRGAVLGLTHRQVLTLASIVEREARAPRERPLVASVYWNRLRRGMKLDADPTLLYGLGRYDWEPRLRTKDLRLDQPYNTYLHKGLPPGPIASPGAASIHAVLEPAETRYLYFVSKNDGTHAFSATLKEHARRVAEFQKHPSEREE